MHPMAAAMNAIGYDAAALGNHEFNYGLDTLRTFESQLRLPAARRQRGGLARPARRSSRRTSSRPFKRRRGPQAGQGRHPRPGHARRRDLGQGERRGQDQVPRASSSRPKVVVPRLKAAGCDLVIVVLPLRRDTVVVLRRRAALAGERRVAVAEQVPGIDAILVGHAHVEIAERFVASKVTTGKQVLLSEPLRWGMRLSVMDLDLVVRRRAAGSWSDGHAQRAQRQHRRRGPGQVAELRARATTQVVRTYVNSVIGTCTAAMSAATARFEDSAAIDFINHVQAEAVKAGAGRHAGRGPAGAVDRRAVQPRRGDPGGEVTVRDVAGLYIYDNTLLGIAVHRRPGEGLPRVLGGVLQAGRGAGPFPPTR